MRLDSSVSAIITGGASGLGAATARKLASAGVRVALFDKNPQTGEAMAKELGALYCDVDVTSDASVDSGFAKARAAHGQERVLVNCAGGGFTHKTASFDKATGAVKPYPIPDFERIMQLNLIGTFRCIAKSSAGMISLDPAGDDGERGASSNTASVAAFEGQVGQVAYAASKAGIVGLTLVVARDLSGNGVRCNTIVPGTMDTPMLARAPEAVKQALAEQVPFPRRLGRAEEFASLAFELLANSYLNGECVRLDGAIRMGPR